MGGWVPWLEAREVGSRRVREGEDGPVGGVRDSRPLGGEWHGCARARAGVREECELGCVTDADMRGVGPRR